MPYEPMKIVSKLAAVLVATFCSNGLSAETLPICGFDKHDCVSAWHIECPQIGSRCSANQGGLRLLQDLDGAIILSGELPQNARVSVRFAHHTEDHPDLFERSLRADEIRSLDYLAREITIETNGVVLQRYETAGMFQAAVKIGLTIHSSDCAEVNCNNDNALPENAGVLYPRTIDNPASIVIPSQKPQVEFAIRSQGGTSVFE